MKLNELPSSNTVYRIPKSHRHCHLHNFEEPKPALEKATEKFLNGWESGEAPAPKLLLTGKPGRGKSHLAVGIYRHGVYTTNLTDVYYLYVPDFCDRVKKGYGDWNKDDPYEDINKASLVVLDDILGADMSSHDLGNIISKLIRNAYNHNQSLVVTTHYTIDELGSYLETHEMSRLMENAIRVKLTSDKDYRLHR